VLSNEPTKMQKRFEMDKKIIVYIMGYGRSGSTILDFILNSTKHV